MDPLHAFAQRIEAQLATSRELPVGSGADFEQSMSCFAERLQLFASLAGRLMVGLIRPRMERLAGYFPDTTISKPDDPYHCTCWFRPQGQAPGIAILQLGIDHDERLERSEFTYELKIVPAFIPYEQHDKLVIDLVPGRIDAAWRTAGSKTPIDEQRIAAWVETRLLGFVEAYLSQQRSGALAGEGPVVDPVCGMRIRLSEAKASEEYKGHRYHFCSNKCGQLFAAAPERFAQVVTE